MGTPIAAKNEGTRSQETLQRPTFNKITAAGPRGSVKLCFIIRTRNNNNKNQFDQVDLRRRIRILYK